MIKSLIKEVALLKTSKGGGNMVYNGNQNNGNNGGDNGGSTNSHKPMCWKCFQAAIHTGGKPNCTWKNLSDDEAKAKEREWVAAKRAQGG